MNAEIIAAIVAGVLGLLAWAWRRPRPTDAPLPPAPDLGPLRERAQARVEAADERRAAVDAVDATDAEAAAEALRRELGRHR